MSAETKALYEFDKFRCDPREHLLLCHGKPVSLSPKSFEILVARRHQSVSILLPLYKPLVQLALAQRRELFGTLLQTARAGRTVGRIGTQLIDVRFALQPGSLRRTRIQPRHNRSYSS